MFEASKGYYVRLYLKKSKKKKKNVASIMLLLSLDGGGVIILPVWHMFLTPILGH